jgi:hypothetical protein
VVSSSASLSSSSVTLLLAASWRRHSCRAVVASQLPIRSGYSILPMCSSNRSQVAWTTSAASVSRSLKSLVMAQISLEY